MKSGFYLQTSRIEETHWWFRHRRRLVERLLGKGSGGAESAPGLEVGCGSGGNLELISRHTGWAVGLDLSEQALRLAREKHPTAALLRSDANRLGAVFVPESFGTVTLFNVLYHRWVQDDGDVLRQAAGLLRPGGRLLLTEPAFRSLFRRHDVLDDGARRYRLSELRAKVEAAGLTVSRATYFNAPGLPPALLLALIEKIRSSAGRETGKSEEAGELQEPASWINRALYRALALERCWIMRVGRMPAGVTALILAVKRAG
jgi:SAM-dependent methyltransferase